MLFFNSPFFFATKKNACASFFVNFQASSVTNICLSDFIFPAKKLRKNTGAQNTHAPIFFFFCGDGF